MNYNFIHNKNLSIIKLIQYSLILIVVIVSLQLTILRETYYLSTKENMTGIMCFQTNASIHGYKDLAAQILQKEEIKKFCSQISEITELPQHRHFLINAEHKLLYCWIHKVASTSWIALFSHLANRTNIDKYYREIKFLSPKTREQLYEVARNEEYYKLLVVRHPFERLVSAFRDRIEDNSKYTSQAWIYVPRIFSLTRPSLTKLQIFNHTYHHKLLIVPTFQEFVTWLLAVPPIKYDVHWNRYSDHCDPCNINYDSIIKMDHFNQYEELLIMHDMGLDQLNLSLQHFHKTSGGPTNFTVSCQYFHQLTMEQVQQLYQVYKNDFEMFQYTLEPYINCAENSSIYTNNTLSNNINYV